MRRIQSGQPNSIYSHLCKLLGLNCLPVHYHQHSVSSLTSPIRLGTVETGKILTKTVLMKFRDSPRKLEYSCSLRMCMHHTWHVSHVTCLTCHMSHTSQVSHVTSLTSNMSHESHVTCLTRHMFYTSQVSHVICLPRRMSRMSHASHVTCLTCITRDMSYTSHVSCADTDLVYHPFLTLHCTPPSSHAQFPQVTNLPGASNGDQMQIRCSILATIETNLYNMPSRLLRHATDGIVLRCEMRYAGNCSSSRDATTAAAARSSSRVGS